MYWIDNAKLRRLLDNLQEKVGDLGNKGNLWMTGYEGNPRRAQ